MDQTAGEGLGHDERVQGDANAVVGVSERALRADGLEAQDEERGRQQNRHDLQPDVHAQGHARVPVVESRDQNGAGHDGQESDGGEDAVAHDEGAVARHVAEAVAHACRPVSTFLGLVLSLVAARSDTIPLYCMVSKLRPWRFGSRNVLRCESHVPSPTYILSDE